MPGGSRSLPSRPNLRYLKLEAKRRVAAGEFPTLHEAQAAIAREHGLLGWTALKRRVDAERAGDGHSPALDQLRWVIARFAGAGDPGWTAPAGDELRRHFSDQLLTELPPPALIAARNPSSKCCFSSSPVGAVQPGSSAPAKREITQRSWPSAGLCPSPACSASTRCLRAVQPGRPYSRAMAAWASCRVGNSPAATRRLASSLR